MNFKAFVAGTIYEPTIYEPKRTINCVDVGNFCLLEMYYFSLFEKLL